MCILALSSLIRLPSGPEIAALAKNSILNIGLVSFMNLSHNDWSPIFVVVCLVRRLLSWSFLFLFLFFLLTHLSASFWHLFRAGALSLLDKQ